MSLCEVFSRETPVFFLKKRYIAIVKHCHFRKQVHLCFCLSLAILPLLSCAARISGPLAADGSAAVSVNVSLEPRMAALISRLSSAAGGQASGKILDGPAIARSMSAAPGVASVSFANTAPAAIEGPVRISRVGDFLAAGNRAAFITFTQGSSGGRCVITISRETSPEILSLFSSDIVGYLEALMAPLATGEKITKSEYLSLVTSVYNKPISDEISGSRIHASIDFPGPVTSVKGGTFSGRRAVFDIPLLDLLVLETPLSYEAAWN